MQTKQIMALAINIEDLLNKQKIESNRIEFKKGPEGQKGTKFSAFFVSGDHLGDKIKTNI